MLQNLLFLPFIIFVIIAFIIFYRSMKTKPKKIAVIVIAILLPFHYYFYYKVYVENLVSQPLNSENQQKLKKYLIDFKYTHIEHPKFFAPKQQYVSPVLRELKNKENQEYIKKLYNEYLNNDGQITYREVRIISLKISNLARYEK
jgi:Ca2+/Na+ antiporter